MFLCWVRYVAVAGSAERNDRLEVDHRLILYVGVLVARGNEDRYTQGYALY